MPEPLARYTCEVEHGTDGQLRRYFEIFDDGAHVALVAEQLLDGSVILTLRVDGQYLALSTNAAHKLAVTLVEAADLQEQLADQLARAGIAVLVAP